MSGYVALYCNCVRCHRPMTCHPHKVPVINNPEHGIRREPICEPCFHVLNQWRKDQGLEPWPDPLPGAYEACPEEEL